MESVGAAGVSEWSDHEMEAFFGETDIAFTVQGTCPGPACGNPSDVIGPRHYKPFAAAVEDTKSGRMHAGAHFNVSVRHGAEIRAGFPNSIRKNWDRATPSGILPYSAYLSVVSKQPPRAGD